MTNVSATSSSYRLLAGVAALLAVGLIALVGPSSGEHEFLLLAALGVLAVGSLFSVAVQHGARILRAMRMERRQHALFKQAAEGSRQAFYLCKPVLDIGRRVVDFRLIYANAAAERLFHCNRGELLGKPISAFLSRQARLSVMARWVRVAAHGASEDFEMAVQPAGVEASAHKARVVGMAGGVAVSMLEDEKDQSAEARVDARIQELNDFAQAIIESAPISMIATDANGTIMAMNSAAEQLTLYRKHELVGQHSLVILHDGGEMSSRAVQLSKDLEEPVSAGFQSLIAKPRHGQSDEREWTYIRKDGSRVWVNLTMTKLRTTDEKTQGYLGIAFDITERKRLADSIAHMAQHDQLTGLPNRGLLLEKIALGMDRVKRSGKMMAVFLVDIDNFKRINDSLGHAGGDKLLTFLANQLLGAVRGSDTVARVSGDAFVVVLPDIRMPEDAERCAMQMLEKICTPIMLGDREVRVTASIGCCLYPDGADKPAELIRAADTAMYEARKHGWGGFQMYSPEMEKETADRLEMEEDLRRALENGEISLHYQPQVRCSTGEVTGMEMLMRWNSPKRGSVPPSVFIPAAEEAGLLVGIGEWALRKACFDCVEAQRRLGIPLTVAVNLSARQYSQRNLMAVVKEALAASGLPAKQLEMEITEEMLMTNTPAVMDTLQDLRALGVMLAIDDFGTGFSSFSYILQYNVDRLKIDQSFVAKCLTDPGAAAIVRAIMAMAHGLKIDVVAEGVETVEQMDFLLRRKCDFAQGFLLSKAVALEDFVAAVEYIDAFVLTQQRIAREALSRKAREMRKPPSKVLEMPNDPGHYKPSGQGTGQGIGQGSGTGVLLEGTA